MEHTTADARFVARPKKNAMELGPCVLLVFLKSIDSPPYPLPVAVANVVGVRGVLVSNADSLRCCEIAALAGGKICKPPFKLKR